jgi:hypothetical protein
MNIQSINLNGILSIINNILAFFINNCLILIYLFGFIRKWIILLKNNKNVFLIDNLILIIFWFIPEKHIIKFFERIKK